MTSMIKVFSVLTIPFINILQNVSLFCILCCVDGLIKVADAKTKAQEAKDRAQAALEKASDTKNKVDNSNNDLRDLIKQIREFLMREFLNIV